MKTSVSLASSFKVNRNRLVALWALTIGAFFFFGLRFYYWSITSEAPFSDMADYAALSVGVHNDFNFSTNQFWRSYKPPTLPLVGAATFWLFGDNNFSAWRFVLVIITFISLIWAVAELNISAKKYWPGVLLVWIVAFSKSSIFWSYKFATEGLAEALSYACLAAGLLAFRKMTKFAFFSWGALATVTLLNRPQFLLAIPLMIGVPVLFDLLARRKHVPASGYRARTSVLVLVFALGVLAVWSPWIARGYRIYGHFLPLSTQGPYSFLWELGAVSMTDSKGVTITRDCNELQSEAPTKFSNDFEAQQYAQLFVSAWLKDNLKNYPNLLYRRLISTIVERDVHLTRVSREKLFPGTMNDFLIDKNVFIVALGVLGLILFGFFGPLGSCNFLPLILTTVPWIFGILFLGYPRIFEPSLPFIFYGAVIGPIALAIRVFSRKPSFCAEQPPAFQNFN